MTDKKSWAQNKIVWLISFLVAFFVVKELKTMWFSSESEQKINENTSQSIQKEIDKAKNSTSDGSGYAMETLQNNVQKTINENIANEKDDNKKIASAANTLYGAYSLNVKARPLYCEKFGVKMDDFVREYKKVNNTLYQAIYSIQVKDFAKNKATFDETQMFNMMKDGLLKIVELDTSDMAAQYKLSNKDVCKVLNQEAVDIAKEMDLRLLQPQLSKIVTDGVKTFQ